jgi:hypothetical protein
MCAISALSPQRFRGFGPGDPDKVYSVLLSTRHDTLMSIASHGMRPLPSANQDDEAKFNDFNFARNRVNAVVIDKAKDIYGYPYLLNEAVPELNKFEGIRGYYAAKASYIEFEASPPAAVYGAARLRNLTAEKRMEMRKNKYREPAGIRHSKKRQKKADEDEDYVNNK